MTANEKRLAVREKYKTILGRNKYSQDLRSYVDKKYRDGNYYSDCSSSVCWAYIAAGFPISGSSLLNTVGLYSAKALTDVPVMIQSGVIQNPDALRVGDLLLFAGTDSSRASAGYVGHVEMVGEISGSTVMLYGHGSGNPKRHEMNAYCRSRYNSKTSTKLGNKGLIRVRRLIVEDGEVEHLGGRDLRDGCIGNDVRELQQALEGAGYSVGSCGADGEFGPDTEAAVRAYQRDHGLSVTGVCDAAMCKLLTSATGSTTPTTPTQPATGPRVVISGCSSCNIRTGPGTQYGSVGTAKSGDTFPALTIDGWVPILYFGNICWISPKYAQVEG